MTRSTPPAWLESFQARFSRVLRAPLDRSGGALRDRRDDYSSEACADVAAGEPALERARLAVYNRQYWFRLLDALQRELPLTHRLLGSWAFNGHALGFLEQRAPAQRDLATAADGFAAFLEARAAGEGAAARALAQAARIDEAFRSVLRAAEPPPFVPTAEALAQLESARLVRSPAVRFIEEDRPLLELRAAPYEGERPLPLPPALPAPRSWVLCSTAESYRLVPLEPAQARFFELLAAHTVGHALSLLERTQASEPALAGHVQRWLAEGMRLNLWSGISR